MRQLIEDPNSPLHEFGNGIILIDDPVVNNINSTILRQQLAQVTNIFFS